MKSSRLLVAICIFLLAAVTGKAQNYNNSLRIKPSGTGNGYVAINNLLLDTMDFTVELWIKADTDAYAGTAPFNDPSILGNKDWTHGTNTGLEIAIYTGGTYKVNFTPTGISRTDVVSSGPELMSRWNHIAVSVQRLGYIRLYTNGVLTDSISISSGHGHSLDGTMPYNLCDDGTGAYSHPFSGRVDEFRIWKGVRSTDQIRKYMCRTLPAGVANLMVYYPMQQNTGTTVTDVSGSGHNGTLTSLTATAWQSSDAPVGDSSAYQYTTTWTGQTVTVGSPGSGVFSANNISNGMTGIQVYRTNYPPNTITGVTVPGTDSVYFGVYPVVASSTYQVGYDYTNYPAAVTYENGITLFNRINISTNWTAATATKTTATNMIQSSNVNGNYHFVIGNFTNPVSSVQSLSTGAHEISVYPNPSRNGVLYFESVSGDKAQLIVLNMQGVVVKTGDAENWPYDMNVSDLPDGEYIVHCYGATKQESFKVSLLK